MTKHSVAEIEEDDVFLGAVTADESSDPWTITLSLNEQRVLFKIDTGADVTAIPEAKYDEAQDGPLQKSNRTLKGPNGQNLIVKELINAKLRRDQSEMEEKIYIVKGLQNALVGRPAIQALNLVA